VLVFDEVRKLAARVVRGRLAANGYLRQADS
jgi:hypothetical protein